MTGVVIRRVVSAFRSSRPRSPAPSASRTTPAIVARVSPLSRGRPPTPLRIWFPRRIGFTRVAELNARQLQLSIDFEFQEGRGRPAARVLTRAGLRSHGMNRPGGAPTWFSFERLNDGLVDSQSVDRLAAISSAILGAGVVSRQSYSTRHGDTLDHPRSASRAQPVDLSA